MKEIIPADVLLDSGHFHAVYNRLLSELLDDFGAAREVNQRTGSEIKVLEGGVSFKIDLRDNRLPVVGHRRLYPKTAAAEVAWFLMGTKDVTWLRNHCPIWDKFVEDDGVTIDAAYGYRWKWQFGRHQLKSAVKTLQSNSTDRRIYIGTWDPSNDGLGAPNQKNVPCPVGFTLSVTNNKLHSSLTLRSSDVFVGLPYDVMGHAILMRAIQQELQGVELGTMHVTLAHAHLYKAHYEMAREALAYAKAFAYEDFQYIIGPQMLSWSLGMIENDPDGFVSLWQKLAENHSWPLFSPRPEVIQ